MHCKLLRATMLFKGVERMLYSNYLKRLSKMEKYVSKLTFVLPSVLIAVAFSILQSASCTASEGEEKPVQSKNAVFKRVFAEKPNMLSFEPVEIRFLRFNVFSSQGGDPAIDELFVYSSESSVDVNLTQKGLKRIDASSCIPGYAIHKIENIVDGNLGNAASWVAGNPATRDAPQWVSIEWKEPVVVGAVVYSRDRLGAYKDRVPLDVNVETSKDGINWTVQASIHGVTEDVSVGGLTSYGSSWLSNAPPSPKNDWIRQNVDRPIGGELTEYEFLLQDAFLAEENALLKTAGYADCEQWLIQRHYPEFVEPLHKPESIVPLPTLENGNFSDDEFWRNASSATVHVFASGNFALGPLVEQTVYAALTESFLCLKIEGNRFLSDNRALVSTENLPVRGFIAVRENKVVWVQVDAIDGRETGVEVELQGKWSLSDGALYAKVPLDFLPEYSTRGVYVTLGIGGNNVLPGGRPIHFRPADFSASFSCDLNGEDSFCLTLTATGGRAVNLISDSERIQLLPDSPTSKTLKGVFGQVGPEVEWEAIDEKTEQTFRLNAFRYDPCYRPFCQLKDALERADANPDEERDVRDFLKRASIPGVANPRYADLAKVVANLRMPDEHEDLSRFFDELETEGIDESDSNSKTKREFLDLWKKYRELSTSRRNSENALSAENNEKLNLAERELFWKVRLLKRDFFLSNEDLTPVEHILANKRNPFWPSHNYSDLFDSTWNPGGAVVLIDIPRENGRLAPEKATTREIVRAGDGVIRNPSASFDSTKIYYAKRESQNEYFRIHELDLTTGKTRRISADGPFHDFWPTELPDGGLAFISTRCKKKFICWRPQAFVLYRMNKEGGEIKPLSFANLSEFAPSVADDGRILWTRSEYVDKGADYGHTLWTIRADGTSPELVFGNTINLPQGYANGRRVPDSEDVCCVMISHFGDLNGPVALIDLSKGPHDPAAIMSITPEVPWPGYWARTETFREPVPISRDVFLVAHAAADRFGVYLLDRFGNRELLTIDKEIDTICPQPFGPRETPPITGNPPEPELLSQGMGRFSVANVYRGLEGDVKPGAAKYLRVCQEMPTPLALMDDGTYQADHEPFMEYYASPVDVLQGAFGWSSYVAKGVLGTVEIEKDGSVDFVVPAGKVLFFELLDENYNEIQRMRSVVQLQPGERRSCIGCHESRLSAPEGGLTLASGKNSQTLTAPPWGAGPFWYEKTVQPVLDKNCVECHTAETASENPKQIDLTSARDENKIPASYRSLIQSGDVHYFDYTWGAGKTTKAAPYTFGTFQSKLWEILKDENHKKTVLAPEEEQAIKCWIDLNVPLWGDYQMRRTRD